MENAILTSYEEKRKQSFATFHTTVFELLPALIAEIKKRHEKVGKGETVSSPLADVELETWRQIDKITSTAANILAICSNGATSVLANSSAGYTHLVHANMAVPAHKMLDAKVAIVVNLARECHEFYADLSVTVEDIYPSITSGVDMHTQVFDSIRTMLEEILSQLRGIIEYCLTRNKERCEYITGVADKMKMIDAHKAMVLFDLDTFHSLVNCVKRTLGNAETLLGMILKNYGHLQQYIDDGVAGRKERR